MELADIRSAPPSRRVRGFSLKKQKKKEKKYWHIRETRSTVVRDAYRLVALSHIRARGWHSIILYTQIASSGNFAQPVYVKGVYRNYTREFDLTLARGTRRCRPCAFYMCTVYASDWCSHSCSEEKKCIDYNCVSLVR